MVCVDLGRVGFWLGGAREQVFLQLLLAELLGGLGFGGIGDCEGEKGENAEKKAFFRADCGYLFRKSSSEIHCSSHS